MSEIAGREVFRGYVVRRERWMIAGRSFEFAWPEDMDVLLDDPRTQQRQNVDGFMPYWAQPWPGAVLLAEAVLNGEPGGGRPALELGCGVGIVATVAAHHGWSVIASDWDENALHYARYNAERNNVSLAGTAMIDFRYPPAVPAYDLILGSDLLYEKRNCEPLAHWIAAALNPCGVAMFSDPYRTAAEEFPDCVRAAGLNIRMDCVESLAPAGLTNRGRIWYASRS